MDGDGAGGLVEAWASKDPGGRVAIALWNGTIDQSKAGGDALLDRDVSLNVGGLDPGPVLIRHRRVDANHSNIAAQWDGGDWPDESAWERLRAADRLEELEPERRLSIGADGRLLLDFNMPMPSVSLIELLPAG
jgi:xylan 1,4-beta-xylosidase